MTLETTLLTCSLGLAAAQALWAAAGFQTRQEALQTVLDQWAALAIFWMLERVFN